MIDNWQLDLIVLFTAISAVASCLRVLPAKASKLAQPQRIPSKRAELLMKGDNGYLTHSWVDHEDPRIDEFLATPGCAVKRDGVVEEGDQ